MTQTVLLLVLVHSLTSSVGWGGREMIEASKRRKAAKEAKGDGDGDGKA